MVTNRRGFTLAELLIVVAILGVLVSISIPIFSSQLERAREATDAANIRAQYAEVLSEAITTGASVNVGGAEKITLKQKQAGWQTSSIADSLQSIATVEGAPGTHAWVEYDAAAEITYIKFDGSGSGAGAGSSTNLLGNGFDDWETIRGNKNNDGTITLTASYQDSVLKFGGDNSSKHITLEEGQNYQLIVEVTEASGATVNVKITNRNGSNTYLTNTLTAAGTFEYEYTHASGRDNDVRISLEVPGISGTSKSNAATIKSVKLVKVS